jgi:hypothetical protein
MPEHSFADLLEVSKAEPLPGPLPGQPPAPADWVLERRADGAVLVRVPSALRGSETLPDAVFTFRLGDPQFGYWEGELQRRMAWRCETP